ncbi:MAG: Gfo/Idh/MocA family oxidoreductase [Clostridia bacterium]|nr:Gfo/Idh/MocA family oxidoreductase [Clostridia bacterium]
MIKYGVIGSGWIAEEFVKGAQTVDGMHFAAMYSRTKEKGMEFAENFGCKNVFTDLEEFAKSDIDAVYIASPNSLHYLQSKLMLENGKHVLCEKPITITPDEFEELFSLAKSKNLIYTEAIMMMHSPLKDRVKNALEKIGKITSAHFDFSQLSSKYKALKNGENPNIFNPEMKTGCLRDLGIYCYYPAVEFFGLPEKVSSSAGFVETGADGYGTAVLDYSDKQITLTYSKIGQDFCGSQILGDEGTITIDSISKLTGVKIHFADGKIEEVTGEEEKHIIMAYEAKNFYDFITDFEKNKEKYFEINQRIFEINKLMFQVKNQCKIL